MHGTHLLGFHELADTFGISKQNTRKHVAKPDFPQPVARLACGPVWSASDVATYLERRRQR
ncbi:MAG: helix-turn-helix transcriptional regulator [Gaiellaceae bacterium]